MINTKRVAAAFEQLHAGLDALAAALMAEEATELVGPIEAVRRFRAANPEATTAEAVAALVPHGYNAATIRTQMSRQDDIGPKQNEFIDHRIDSVDPIQMTNLKTGERVQRGKNKDILREMARKLGLPKAGAMYCYSPNGDEFTTHDYARAVLKELNANA
ncbi:hypothetical protein LB534_05015 [Mesorhizobium sp. CA18]|uniref:hypothetical protein n=1 Tax=unclassified Mesorhizobium TaxID=325217 RepID=UPI001CD0359E|nr:MULTISPECIES: hypothetical protein [unclassified Mesorhizobium]MBZ9734356.1 hypothetical protein [Mesorhizobium sp. CA9]MBZ9824637.1 hypothetical protein [Mesorhizobium sp. CA18]MBZ9829405.1 hypothetical protein [Mesorhizobium sp. CA2]MBZ9878005.1 hypothetical protein [Mesorhizobium sp. Ca11]MBZ9902883.1 hypothetical protein [Mesorhizobium sp. CA17]